MNLAGLLRADPRTRGEYYRSLINAGIMSINEVRELEELNSIGATGDEHYMQLAMTTLEHIADGDNMKAAASPPSAAPAEADAAPESDATGEPATPKPADNVIHPSREWARGLNREQAHG
jgi:ribosomal protein L12E/L44/L45/RPP1/RPP2